MGEKYAAYTTTDFLADEDFQQWVRFPDANSNAFWARVLANHPDKKAEVEEAVQLLQSLKFQVHFPSLHEIDAALEKNLKSIKEQEAAIKYRKRNKIVWGSGLAAALVIAFCVINFNVPESSSIMEIATAGSEQRIVVLPDSSKITLNGRSTLRYKADMSQGREVWLEGEAFFDVLQKTGPAGSRKNFIVHSGDLDIEVLGTRFNVKKEKGTTNVSLNSGSIRIGLKGNRQTLLSMKPGDFIQYKPAEKKVTRKMVRPELYSVWKEEKLVLDAVPFSDLVQLIRDTYGYRVVLDDPGMAKERITGPLYIKNEADMLEAIAFTLGITYVKQDSVIHFKSKK